VDELLAQVRLDGEYDKMPAALSGGMKKRAALARAMALKPSVLLVDEPSAGLDPITSEEIDNLLISLGENNDTTLVVVTHNIPSAKRVCDEMIMLDEGRIRARGDLAALEASEDEVVQKVSRLARRRVERMGKTDKSGVGVFLIGGFLLFAIGLFLIGNRQQLFTDSIETYAEFSKPGGLAERRHRARLGRGRGTGVEDRSRRRARCEVSRAFPGGGAAAPDHPPGLGRLHPDRRHRGQHVPRGRLGHQRIRADHPGRRRQ
jgi:hypothetical protein